jgi:DNA-binding transcriptional ArsR family regulator
VNVEHAAVFPDPLPDRVAEAVADRFRVLADPTRLRLLALLRDGERSVGELARAVGCSQANASKQLAQLADAGLLRRRRDGLRCFYTVADPTVFALCDAVCESLSRHWRARAGEWAAAAPPG